MARKFQLKSNFSPKGDQPTAIQKLLDGIKPLERSIKRLLESRDLEKHSLLQMLLKKVKSRALLWLPIKHWRRSFIVK